MAGLDPAGPRFVDGPFVDRIPELGANRLSEEDAAFVDVIHTNGGFEPCIVCPNREPSPARARPSSSCVLCSVHAGAILQLGHMDFYPDGGSVQSGCVLGSQARPGGRTSVTRVFTRAVNKPLQSSEVP